MQATATGYTTESILATLGYPDAMMAARQQARMMLLGRLTRFQAMIQQFERTWGCTLDEMRARYEREGYENFEADDAFLEWQWYAEAVEAIQTQLKALKTQ